MPTLCLSAAIISEIEALASAGEKHKQIAVATGCGLTRVRAVVRCWSQRTNTPVSRTNKRALSPELRARIGELVDQGVAQKEIAEILGISRTSVNDQARAHLSAGLYRPKQRRLSKDESAEAIERLWRGESQTEIARALGVSSSAIRRRDYNYRLRHGKESLPPPVLYTPPSEEIQQARARRKAERARLHEAQNRREAAMLSSQLQSARRDQLYAKIAAQVPRWINGAMRDDIISDAYLKAMEHSL